MRRAAKTDANQVAVVAALRAVGASVLSLAAVGKGCPDLVIAHRGRTWLAEVKDGSKPPSARRLTPDQVRFHREWRAPIAVVTSPSDALALLGLEVTA